MAARSFVNTRGQPPSTPTKQNVDTVRAEINSVFQALNADLGLRLVAPDPAATPSSRKQRADQSGDHCNQIWSEFQYQYHQGDIDSVLREFHVKAKKTLSGWVPKPRAATTTPYRARDDGQVEALQELLRDVLVERRKQMPKRSSRLFNKGASSGTVLERSNGASRATGVSTSRKHGAKRMSDDESLSDESVKRPKSSGREGGAKVTLEKANSDLDSVMVRESFTTMSMSFSGPSRTRDPRSQPRYTPPPATARRPSPPNAEISSSSCGDRSANASSTSLASTSTNVSAVFSTNEDGNAPFNTQTTVEASSQEQKRTNPRLSKSAYMPPRSEARDPSSSSRFSDAEPSLDELQAMWDAEQVVASRPSRIPAIKTKSQNPPSSSPSRSAEISPTYSSSWSGSLVDTLAEQAHAVSEPASKPAQSHNTLQDRLDLVWPKFPNWLRDAPLAVAWEVCRVALHCEVDLSKVNGMAYHNSWKEQKTLRSVLYQRPEFRTRAFPEQSSSDAWAAALDSFNSRGQSVVLSATLDFNMAPSGPLFILRMGPLKLHDSHRLSRRFGSDRFLEVLYPSPNSAKVPPALRGEDAREAANNWLARGDHRLAGRQWAAFYTKDSGYKKPTTHLTLGPDSTKGVFKDRTYFFAIDGHDFRTPSPKNSLPSKDQKVIARTRLSVYRMLDWLLQLRKNTDQPYLKLFSRIALGLSPTYPTVTFEPHQIRTHAKDLLSPEEDPHMRKRNVMNDGVGRMSRSVARKIQKTLGLVAVPCAVQGRLGSAKGMWIIDVEDLSGEDWIETYPSQRKWECDISDPDQRTLEVRRHASELHSARLNLQFLPVLEYGSQDKAAFRAAVGGLLGENLQTELGGLRVALNRPIQHRQWVHENSTNRDARIRHGKVPFLGGIPDNDEETMNMMLDHGFDPKKQKYLQDLAWGLQKKKCETLKEKLNITVGRSAYVYMVVDFWGLLEEDEVHICFSSKFQVDDFADTLLDGIDLLVARSPAHYISDIQKVKAVFKPALKDLKDVIVFPRKGRVALADKLSGGDYDGDMAWVCWDQVIVNNFESSPVPKAPDLFEMGYLGKIKDKMDDLVKEYGLETATSELIERSFLFNMRQNYLGICTNFKEKLCYKRRKVHDHCAVLLSTLLSNLVDQSKQGIEFSAGQWRQLRAYLGEDKELDLPLYKEGNWPHRHKTPDHIIDYLKFSVAKPLIDKELGIFYKAISGAKTAPGVGGPSASPSKAGSGQMADATSSEAHYFDGDLTEYYNEFNKRNSRSVKALLTSLQRDIYNVEKKWKQTMREVGTGKGVSKIGGNPDFRSKVLEVYDKWLAIQPDKAAYKALADSNIVFILEQHFWDPEDSQWALLRASMAFKLSYHRNHKFVWRMAGRQLMRLKSLAVARTGGPAMAVVPGMYAALRPDGKIIKQLVARDEGSGSQYTGARGRDDGSDDEDDGWNE
ncbi:hypothetical protein RB595_006809 [Gaeumannomyces hyphopodioides]